MTNTTPNKSRYPDEDFKDFCNKTGIKAKHALAILTSWPEKPKWTIKSKVKLIIEAKPLASEEQLKTIFENAGINGRTAAFYVRAEKKEATHNPNNIRRTADVTSLATSIMEANPVASRSEIIELFLKQGIKMTSANSLYNTIMKKN